LAKESKTSLAIAAPKSQLPKKQRWPLLYTTSWTVGTSTVITAAEWDGNAWLPDPLSSAAVLTTFYLGLVVLPWVTARGAWRLLAWIYRTANRSRSSAGLICAGSCYFAFKIVAGLPEDPTPKPGLDRVFQVASEADGFANSTRALLMAVAEQVDRAEYYRRTTPEMRAGVTDPATPLPSPLIAGALGAGGGGASQTSLDPEECVTEILGIENRSSTAVDQLATVFARQNSNISYEDARDLIVDTLIELCLADERKSFDNLKAMFRRAFKNNLIDLTRTPNRKYCDLVDRIPESCTFSDMDFSRLPGELRIARELLCTKLTGIERRIYELRVAGEYRFREIGDKLGLTEYQAKDKFHYAKKKIRTAFKNRCRPSR